jgi:hypothetical protein
MALAHNGMIRGLNSIYLQAPNIPIEDQATVRDFLIYCQCWCESMHHHHDAEEANFFPSIEDISGLKGLMEQNIEQHREFTPGFNVFHDYVKSCDAKDFAGLKIQSLVKGFGEPLVRHLRDEIDTLRALHTYDSVRIRQSYQKLEKVLMATDNVRTTRLESW